MRSLAIAAVVLVVLMCALFSLSAHTVHDPPVVQSDRTELTPAAHDDDATGSVDLFGNDVSDAVARYSLDATGSLYEVHSPQTEIPKLGSPKS